MKWIFWFFVVNIISVIALMKGFVGDGNMFVGAMIAFSTWVLFIWTISSSQERKRKARYREQMIDDFFRNRIKR